MKASREEGRISRLAGEVVFPFWEALKAGKADEEEALLFAIGGIILLG